MSNIVGRALLQSRNPLLSFRRFRGKINIQRPRQPHYERARVMEVVKPVYRQPEFNAPCLDAERGKLHQKQDNPYDAIIAREVRNWFDHSKMVTFVHMNSIRQEDFFKAQVALHRHNVSVKVYGKAVLRLAIESSIYEAILPLFEAKTAIIFAPDESKIRAMLGVLKKTPQFVLLGGIVHGLFLSKNEMVQFAAQPDLTTVRAQLAAVLESAGARIVSDLQCHQGALVNMLDAYARDDQRTDSSTADADETKT